MESTANTLLTLGGILLLGLFADTLGKRTPLPRVTLLLFFGILIGPQALNLIPEIFKNNFELIADMALLMVGFLIGGKLTKASLFKNGRQMVFISLFAVFGVLILVIPGLWLAGLPLEVAILLGCIASATAPAATMDIVMESKGKGPFGNLLLSITALDDAWALIAFSLGMATVTALQGTGEIVAPILLAGKEIGGAVLLGIALGVPAAYVTGRIKKGQPMLEEALGLVFLCGGAALWLDVSFLIASMVMGSVIANFAHHHERPFHEIEDVEWPFMVMFFMLAGSLLELENLKSIGVAGTAYIIARSAGKYLGARVGSELSGAEQATKRWMGAALLPQAGAAMGMALAAVNRFPEYRQTLLLIIISSTIFFELVGPLISRMAIKKADESFQD